MIPTLRRLDDRERYWGLTWPGWVAVIVGAGVLYAAVRFSPLQAKPTITITLFVLAFVGMALYGVSGQALSPGRQLLAILAYRCDAKQLVLRERSRRRGLVLHHVPERTPRPDAPDLAAASELISGSDPSPDDGLAVAGLAGEDANTTRHDVEDPT